MAGRIVRLGYLAWHANVLPLCFLSVLRGRMRLSRARRDAVSFPEGPFGIALPEVFPGLPEAHVRFHLAKVSYEPGNRVLAMLVAYFDESGTHGKDARVTTISGLVGDSIAWARLELPWKARLAKAGVACFHATDCAHALGDFSHLSKQECNELSNDLVALIAQRELMAVSSGFYRDDWEYGASDLLKKMFPSKYHACLAMTILQVHDISVKHCNGAHVAFVFAEHQQYADYALAIHEVFQHGRWKTVGHMCFAKPELVIPLQAADLISYENYRELLSQLDNPAPHTAPVREQLRTLYRGMPVAARFGGIEFLHAYANAVDASPAIASLAGKSAPLLKPRVQ